MRATAGASPPGLRRAAGLFVPALPRGGVPVGYEVARALQAHVDVFVVRKLGVPGHAELAMGAVASGGVTVLKSSIVEAFGIPSAVIDSVVQQLTGGMWKPKGRKHVFGRPGARPRTLACSSGP